MNTAPSSGATEQAPATAMSRASALASTNLAIKFGLELAALALLAYWGTTAGTGVWAVLLGVAAPAAMVGIWATLAAPRSAHRLTAPARVPLELAIFAIAATAGYAAGATVPAIAFAAVAIINAIGLTALNQWER